MVIPLTHAIRHMWRWRWQWRRVPPLSLRAVAVMVTVVKHAVLIVAVAPVIATTVPLLIPAATTQITHHIHVHVPVTVPPSVPVSVVRVALWRSTAIVIPVPESTTIA